MPPDADAANLDRLLRSICWVARGGAAKFSQSGRSTLPKAAKTNPTVCCTYVLRLSCERSGQMDLSGNGVFLAGCARDQPAAWEAGFLCQNALMYHAASA